ncbi:hypothetical protein [Hyphomicrobium sp. 2TAF46]|uniref:hypothetical protein n=1 Tax=Hyphomicrobium sp. 2TAF46 TaxID=3233019 RepID=UPI003F935F54
MARGRSRRPSVGNISSAPLKAGDGSAHFRAPMMWPILPVLDDFRPDLILVSAGFDALRAASSLASRCVSVGATRMPPGFRKWDHAVALFAAPEVR